MEWTITLDDDYVNNATQLSIARTVIHENVHAFVGMILNSNNTSDMAISLQSLYTYYKFNNPDKLVQNLTQHEFMSQYVDAMAVSLSVWDNKQQSMEYYKKLCWAGLESSSVYQAQLNKNEIQETIQNEATNSVNAKGQECN
ncbi:hypothetical protein GO009_01790 [Muricauda sp. TY007]|uniref:hypothetical protein n=1 Tax=Allomuricauda sp. TY007 TaxID=2683200 RepID=UPI0013C27024|nr:hypothetical protein [Muricauda sp. TY007]NDV14742.1 hypothetical protein [Muricauda sp. TY007]